MRHVWAAALACNTPAARKKRRRKPRYDLGTPPEGYEKTPGGGDNSYRRRRPDGGYDYWYDEGAAGPAAGAATAERPAGAGAAEEELPDWSSSADHYAEADFAVDGTPFKFMAHQMTAGGPFEITFTQIKGNRRLVTQEQLPNKMSALKVFGVVRRLTDKFVAEKKPKQFKFSAALNEPARVRLYEKLAERLERQGQYKLVAKEFDGKKVFLFQRIDRDAGRKPAPWWQRMFGGGR